MFFADGRLGYKYLFVLLSVRYGHKLISVFFNVGMNIHVCALHQEFFSRCLDSVMFIIIRAGPYIVVIQL